MMQAIFLEAPAKINLYLSVLGRFTTGPYAGYHDLDMLMQSISLKDLVTIEKRQGSSYLTVAYPNEVGVIPEDENNLAMRAWRLLQEKYGLPEGIAIHIEKNIPVGAGLAGGSSDAAAVLKGINQLFGLGISLEELARMGASLGGDVPFCIYQGLARAEGMGERVTPLPALPSRDCVLVNPGISVLTSEIFREYDIIEKNKIAKDKHSFGGPFSQLSWEQVDQWMQNDLEAAAIGRYPVIAEIKEDLAAIGLHPFMSGSGPSVIAFWQGATERKHIEEKIAPKWPITVFCQTI
ncbi:MAG: 4-(cytidine 5'-diphospho)-2-C-methyl-D-erythritol kinase [Peptococcaceae bacterium]|jgi:4-diphosphocytidyl-2-C-methyl-D-erythritol kinase|nr:4-(cytidine 5'-diphospho)-2-C-methyl-D-erythritol kinase [Peptococcaceae bacterium]